MTKTETQKTKVADAAHQLLNIPLDRVRPSDNNPRMTLAKDALQELTKSIAKNGLLQPIAVRVVADDDCEIVGGHRRYLALRELARANPADARFAVIPAMVVDAADTRVAAMRLAENINRADLAPHEIAEGVADALENGMTAEELAESLGWAKRHVYRYSEFHAAPEWLKTFASGVQVPRKKVDDKGEAVLDPVTEKPIVEVDKLPGLKFTHLHEFLTAYNVLHDADKLEFEEHGGEKFKPQAERTIKNLARAAAKEEWSLTKLRAEIKRAKDPAPKTPAPETEKPAFAITAERVTIDLTRKLARNERDELAQQLTKALAAFGLKAVPTTEKTA